MKARNSQFATARDAALRHPADRHGHVLQPICRRNWNWTTPGGRPTTPNPQDGAHRLLCGARAFWKKAMKTLRSQLYPGERAGGGPNPPGIRRGPVDLMGFSLFLRLSHGNNVPCHFRLRPDGSVSEAVWPTWDRWVFLCLMVDRWMFYAISDGKLSIVSKTADLSDVRMVIVCEKWPIGYWANGILLRLL